MFPYIVYVIPKYLEPFHEIYMGRNQDEVFFSAWRIREECNSVGEYHTQEVSIPPETPFSQESTFY
jgi:hypothetical protein